MEKIIHIETEREEDGRWIAVVREHPGVMCYGVDTLSAAEAVIGLLHGVDARALEGATVRLVLMLDDESFDALDVD